MYIYKYIFFNLNLRKKVNKTSTANYVTLAFTVRHSEQPNKQNVAIFG